MSELTPGKIVEVIRNVDEKTFKDVIKILVEGFELTPKETSHLTLVGIAELVVSLYRRKSALVMEAAFRQFEERVPLTIDRVDTIAKGECFSVQVPDKIGTYNFDSTGKVSSIDDDEGEGVEG